MTAETRRHADALLGALRAGDAGGAVAAVRAAGAAGLRTELVLDRVVAPAMYEVGALWACGEMSVADEHAATAIAYRLVNVACDPPVERDAGPRVLLATLEDEQHRLGLHMAARVLHHAGYRVTLTAAGLAVPALGAEAARRRPAVVGVSVTRPRDAEILDLADELAEIDPPPVLLVGGSGAPHLLRRHRLVRVVPDVRGAVGATDAALAARDVEVRGRPLPRAR